MIRLSNGFEFSFAAAAGALGFDGDDGGHGLVKLYKKPHRWLGKLDPRQFAIITKTLTCHQRYGNLRWYAPWRAVRLLRPWSNRSMVNAVALTNPGIDGWLDKYYQRICRKRYKVIVSIQPENKDEAVYMTSALQKRAKAIVGIEINAGCPNVRQTDDDVVKHTVEVFSFVRAFTTLPIIVKLGYHQPWEQICKALDGKADAFDLINAIPWDYLNAKGSPLQKYGYSGSVSGNEIAYYAVEALMEAKRMKLRTPIISGGGVVSYKGSEEQLWSEVRYRFDCGADAIAFGTEFLWNPGGPNRIVKQFGFPPPSFYQPCED